MIYKRSAFPGGEDPPLYTAATNIVQNEIENNRPINQNLCGVTGKFVYELYVYIDYSHSIWGGEGVQLIKVFGVGYTVSH